MNAFGVDMQAFIFLLTFVTVTTKMGRFIGLYANSYSKHLITGQVWYSNDPNMVGCGMVWFSNGDLKTGKRHVYGSKCLVNEWSV